MKVRYGIIGYGRWGKLHIQAIRKAEGAELTAIAVSSEATKRTAEAEQGVPVYTNYQEMLKRSDIDVVDIVLPNHLHYDAAMAALRAGKHLLLEKPLALTEAECREIIEEARKRGLLIHVGHELRFSPLWGRVKRMLEEGRIGALKMASISLSRHPFRDGAGGWRKDAARVGSWILEEPVHFLDLLRWYYEGAETPVSVYAVGNSRDPRLEESGMFENFSATIRFSKGGAAVFNQSLAAYEHHLTGEFVGTSGVLKLWWSGATDEVLEPRFSMEYYDGAKKLQVELEKVPGEVYELDYEIAQYTRVIAEGGTPSVTGEDGLWAVKLSLAAQESAAAGTLIRL
jgi:myo-inositol 2-dehydrogenase/D-chiro-inositol 1-dehydrogenase